MACDAAESTTVNVGTFSPSAIKASAPFQKATSGFNCTGFTILTLLSANYLKATIAAGTVLKLTSSTSPSDTITYKLFADAAATTELKAGTTAFYMNGAVLNLLNLLGDGTIDAPLYFKLASTGYVAPGTYTGSFSIKWDWNFCNGIAALGLCIGVTDSGSKTSVIDITLMVAANPPTVSFAFDQVAWDPINGTNKPKAISGSKRRLVLTVTNPDIVPTELAALQVLLPTPSNMAVALDGDGTGSGTIVQFTDGNPTSGVIVAYAGASSSSDQVDFSSDAGSTWTYAPVAGNLASESAVNAVRFRPQGAMAAKSTFTLSLPYRVK